MLCRKLKCIITTSHNATSLVPCTVTYAQSLPSSLCFLIVHHQREFTLLSVACTCLWVYRRCDSINLSAVFVHSQGRHEKEERKTKLHCSTRSLWAARRAAKKRTTYVFRVVTSKHKVCRCADSETSKYGSSWKAGQGPHGSCDVTNLKPACPMLA